jgi:hypothetical protein
MKLLLIIAALTFGAVFPVAGQIKFFKVFADNGYDFGQGVVQLDDSSYMVTGASTSFEDSPSQVFLLKADKEGNHVWSKHYGGSETDFGRRVLNWNDSVFFLTGYTNSFGAGAYDFYVVKVDENGEFIDQKTYGYEGWEKLNDALITPDSSLVLVGESTSTSNSNRDFYIVKTDKNGDTLWTRKFGSSGEDFLNAVVQLDATSFYAVGGHFNEDSTLIKAAVLKFNDQGDVLWLKEFGSHGEYYLNDLYLKNGKLFAGGTRKHPEFGDQDEYLLRINDDGTYFMDDAQVHQTGNVEYVAVTLYGAETNAYVVSSYTNSFSTNNSQDIGYTRFQNNLDWEWSNPSVPFVLVNFLMEDVFGEVLRTSDDGWVSAGSVSSDGLGGSAVYLMKIGVNDDYPTVDLNTVNSLVTVVENDLNDTVNMFPNPVENMLVIEHGQHLSFSVDVRDLNGRQIYSGAFSSTVEIPVMEWGSGIYLVNVTDQNEVSVIRRVVVR